MALYFLGVMILCLNAALLGQEPTGPDPLQQLQSEAITNKTSPLAWWGQDPDVYVGWSSHSNRLIPVYTYGTGNAAVGSGLNLADYQGENSAYRSVDKLRRIYGYTPVDTVSETATWLDQTNIADLQTAAAAAGRRYIFLVVFDGMDWQTTQAAAIWNQRAVSYREGRGDGTHLQRYTADGTSQYGFMVTSPHNAGSTVSVNHQTVENPGGTSRGGYSATLGGATPWSLPADMGYLISTPAEGGPVHAYTDSASSATSMTAAIKTFNGAINVDATGSPVQTIAHRLQEAGWRIGVVSSVPISHATPAAAYSHNVTRNDYQDLTRDLLGLPSVQHPETPMPGVDLLIGGGYGKNLKEEDGISSQGENFVAGNMYLADADLQQIDSGNGGRYVTAVRTAGRSGADLLNQAVTRAVAGNKRVFGFFGVGSYNGHLPFETADGTGNCAQGKAGTAEEYSAADRAENPTLDQMTTAALNYLGRQDGRPFWLMVESGDVDWANHDNNLDNSIGAVNSGDRAVRVITDWVEANSNWSESLLIVTADHGHLLNLANAEMLAEAGRSADRDLTPKER